MDQIHISALSVPTTIGVHAWEQRIKQTLLIDITLEKDLSACADDLADTIDYDALCTTVTNFVASGSFKLIETVANQVAQLIQEEFKVTHLSVCVSKPHAIKNAKGVQVCITR